MIQELLNIKRFSERKFKKIKIMCLKEIGASSWYYKKALDYWDFLGLVSQFLHLRQGIYIILRYFYH
jgi:hypothetical protein